MQQRAVRDGSLEYWVKFILVEMLGESGSSAGVASKTRNMKSKFLVGGL